MPWDALAPGLGPLFDGGACGSRPGLPPTDSDHDHVPWSQEGGAVRHRARGRPDQGEGQGDEPRAFAYLAALGGQRGAARLPRAAQDCRRAQRQEQDAASHRRPAGPVLGRAVAAGPEASHVSEL